MTSPGYVPPTSTEVACTWRINDIVDLESDAAIQVNTDINV